MGHIPVLLATALEVLRPKEGEVVIDCTVGLGGHARAFLERIGPMGQLIGLDADAENLTKAKEVLGGANVKLVHANFATCFDTPSPSARPSTRASTRLGTAQDDVAELPSCDILFADLGVSSPHFDDPERGFSFRSDGPLDCRYDRSRGKTAAEFLNSAREEELLRMFRTYGELHSAEKLVQAIFEARKRTPLARTGDLVHLAEQVYGWRAPKFLPQVFQALRIAVNDELSALEALLASGPLLLRPGGRMGILSYHSLEDRLVKERFRSLTTAPKHPVTGADLSPAPFRLLTKGAVKATLRETEENPRARSCRFRAIEKIF